MTALVITVDLTDPDDLDWLRARCVPAVENAVEEATDEERLDGDASVSWEVSDE
jgi:hypothetical protein